MHSMSKEFYNYLAQRTVDFFQSTLIQEGEKYILNFNDENEVHSFYEALDNLLQIKADIKREYSIIDDDKYDTLGLTTKGNVCVFVVPELNITQAYMTRLRNTIKANWAMLIVACNSIDSISRGTESLSKDCRFVAHSWFQILKKRSKVPVWIQHLSIFFCMISNQ